MCQATLAKVDLHTETIRLGINEALENRALENGQITRANFEGLLETFQSKITDDVGRQLADMSDDVGRQLQLLRAEGFGAARQHQRGDAVNMMAPPKPESGQMGTLFAWHDRFWDVPVDFQFPASLKRNAGWHPWLLGMLAYERSGENGQSEYLRIKAFRLILPPRLPKRWLMDLSYTGALYSSLTRRENLQWQQTPRIGKSHTRFQKWRFHWNLQ